MLLNLRLLLLLLIFPESFLFQRQKTLYGLLQFIICSILSYQTLLLPNAAFLRWIAKRPDVRSPAIKLNRTSLVLKLPDSVEVGFQDQGCRVIGRPRTELLHVHVIRNTLVGLVENLILKTSTRTKKMSRTAGSTTSLVDVMMMMRTSEHS